MKVIFVKSFTAGDIEENVPPILNVTVEGKDYGILNFRNYYFCEKSNTLEGREGQVSTEVPNVYEQFNSTLFNCLVPFLEKSTSYKIYGKDSVSEFLKATKQFYGVM